MERAKYFIVTLLSILSLSALALPIHIEDSHAGSFKFFATHLDLEETYTLVLIDAHSDASGIPESDRLRHQLRHVLSDDERNKRIGQWRQEGIIQPFNWIEPLMPRPFSKVIWIAGEKLDAATLQKKQKQARIQLDWQTQAAPRKCGELGIRFDVTDWQQFIKNPPKGPLAISIDLDYFANIQKPNTLLQSRWLSLLALPDVEAVSIAISRPWLKTTSQAHELTEQALRLSLLSPQAELSFEPFLNDTKDRSELAKRYYFKNTAPPRYELSSAPSSLQSLILTNKNRIHVNQFTNLWKKQLALWQAARNPWQLSIEDHQVSTDRVWRAHCNKLKNIILRGPKAVDEVIWYMRAPTHETYNLMPHLIKGRSFTGPASAQLSFQRHEIARTEDRALAVDTWSKYLPGPSKTGRLILEAEVIEGDQITLTSPIEIRVREREGIAGSLSEQHGLPYIFGIGLLCLGQESGPETLLGNDCANFIIHALRLNGYSIPWGDPSQFCRHLEPLAKNQTPTSRPSLSSSPLHVINFGNHVAALWEDLAPLGQLNSEDLVIHHLGGPPEITTLGSLLSSRKKYDLYQLGKTVPKHRIVIGGDVNLATHNPVSLPQALIETIQNADLSIVNLESSLKGDPPHPKPFLFNMPKRNLSILNKWKVDAVSLANNHAGDGGSKALSELCTNLNKTNITPLGVGPLKKVSHIKRFRIGKYTIGVLAFNMIETSYLPSTQHNTGVLSYPAHKSIISKAITKANQACDLIIALPHWGKEYTPMLTEEQRLTARWLIDQGVDLIAGAHSHYPQDLHYYRGKPIIYSLGNLFFPNTGPDGFDQQLLLTVEINQNGKIIPIKWSP